MKTVFQTALMLVICASGYSDTNVALRGQATQSSVLFDEIGPANKAIDGNPDPAFWHGTCTHTNSETGPWWRLDMLDEYQVNSVSITNRNEYPEWLNGAEIRIGNSLVNNGNDNPRCAVIDNAGSGETRAFQCHGMEGQYLNVVIPGKTTFLILCEVQVFGDLVLGHAG